MLIQSFAKFFTKFSEKICTRTFVRGCHGVFGIQDLIHQVKPHRYQVYHVAQEEQSLAVEVIKQHYLPEHALVRARDMDLSADRAMDHYLTNLLKQGNSLYAQAEDGEIAGVSINYASSPIDPNNLRNYAFYRQDQNTKDFLFFTAKLQETPNLWDLYKQPKIFEIKMIAVLPQYRRQGVAKTLVEKSRQLANDQGYKVVRMDCINSYDYKIAERCMLTCLVKFPLSRVRGPNGPYIKPQSEYNRCVRVYVHMPVTPDLDRDSVKERAELESLIE